MAILTTKFEVQQFCWMVTFVLTFPDFTKEFNLDTDVSDQRTGAALSQLQSDGHEKVNVYAGHLLSK